MVIAQRQLATAEAGFREELTRTRGGVGLPIEVVNSLDLLTRARQDVITAIIEYDQAQFRLFVALGNPPAVAVAQRQSRGAIRMTYRTDPKHGFNTDPKSESVSPCPSWKPFGLLLGNVPPETSLAILPDIRLVWLCSISRYSRPLCRI